ncbi:MULTISPECIES: cysteine synthase CysM [unclassified Cobetia]|uniref:cysteine synthase CysM n=1 Tax=unclassified Cobetia TaxID=2609414 RepID=UPI0020984D2D|nr:MULTISPECIES: cysteine synthase CysM [unclassified Cobetia]MCO7232290.1 cysteine synthase CysM [Cobetia sp. Dlab-2-AX]MCO7235333.1 cysteine synthase CysM [Cobetia sp. Dlab-2-U]
MSHLSETPGDAIPGASDYPSLADVVGNTPLVRLTRITAGRNNVLLAKLEGHNPAGSVKDRPALSMFEEAEARGEIAPGDTLVEATSGNTGIALAMTAAIKGYRMVLVMPASASSERKQAMGAYGATLIEADGMEHARDLAEAMIARGEGKALDQFANQDNPLAHYRTTGPELWQQTHGRITHFVSSMGTTGTIMGTSRYLKEQNPAIEIVGLQPAEGASIAGIRRWPAEYLPRIFDASRIDRTLDIGQHEAEVCMRRLAREEGILAGVSSGGALAGALKLAEQVENAVIVFIVCDRGDRYLSTGLYTQGDDMTQQCTPHNEAVTGECS